MLKFRHIHILEQLLLESELIIIGNEISDIITFAKDSNKKEEDIMKKVDEFLSRLIENDILNKAKSENRRIIAVGTTSLRKLETILRDNPTFCETSGWSDIFIYPGYSFKAIDSLITNFHLPKSTLIMLVSALAGKENVMKAYSEAINEKYRFFSFGDSMFIHSRK